MMIDYKKTVSLYARITLAVAVLTPVGLYLHDPLHLFHKPYFTKESFLYGNMRFQAAGIINTYPFDSVILGTSMLENTSAFEAGRLLGGSFANLSVSGSDYYERSLILSYALEKRKIDKVLFSLDEYYLDGRRGHPEYPLEQFDYLYDDDPLNDIKAYWNWRFIRCLYTFSENKKCIGKQKTLEYPGYWYDSDDHASRFGGLRNWTAADNDDRIREELAFIVTASKAVERGMRIPQKHREQRIAAAIRYVDETFLKLVSDHPKTEFVAVFPPFSRLQYALWAQYDPVKYAIHHAVIGYLAQKSGEYPNLRVYGWEDQSFLDDIAHYKDPTHYHPRINRMMLESVARNDNTLRKENVETYLSVSKSKALDYNLTETARYLGRYLEHPGVRKK